MKDYSVTVEITFSVTAANEEKAQERAQVAAQTISMTHAPFTWLGRMEIGKPNVEEA